ncbi:MAG: hypothetical protein MR210_09145 [Erysipelotrichaceae bacterium]|nr:hypothetical protein [Erysipelotrichaceae bacterium]
MKQKLLIKPTLQHSSSYNSKFQQTINVLSLNRLELANFLSEKANNNVFLQYDNNLDILTSSVDSQPSLYDNFLSQINLLNLDIDLNIYLFLLSNIDSNGYFVSNINQLAKESSISITKLLQNIKLLRLLEPVGCFSFSLADCLKAQCESSDSPDSETALILCDYLKDIASNNLSNISNNTSLSLDEIIEGINFIKSLNPKPASNYAGNAQILTPETKILINNNQLEIQLIHNDFTLQLENNELLIQNMNLELEKQRKEAITIINDVKKRNLTILQITSALCEIQHDFFYNNAYIKYCTLNDISKKTGLHTSTISRAIVNKSFEFNNKYYPYKFLFSHKGNKHTEYTKIENKIIEIINHESPSKPLSDQKIKQILENSNIFISRRTITKYRELNMIPSSQERKRK